jgi:hypothetical protein
MLAKLAGAYPENYINNVSMICFLELMKKYFHHGVRRLAIDFSGRAR